MDAVRKAQHDAATPMGPFGPIAAAVRAVRSLSGGPDAVVRSDCPVGAHGIGVKALIMPCQALRGRPQEAHLRW